MNKLGALMAGTATAAVLALAGPAAAGPCTDQINEVARALSNDPSMGPPTSGALAGAAPGAIQNKAPVPQQGTPQGAVETTGDAVKGQAVATTMAGNAPGSQERPIDPAQGRATSPQDVRLQQVGQPAAAQGGNAAALDADKMTAAKMELEKARGLDQQGSADCAAALDRARKAMGS